MLYGKSVAEIPLSNLSNKKYKDMLCEPGLIIEYDPG